VTKPTYEELLDKLSIKRRLFVEAYFASDYNAAEAVRKAGYKMRPGNENRMGYELLNDPKVKATINAKSQKLVDEIRLKPEYITRKLIKIIEAAEQDGNFNAVLRGLELGSRQLGMLTDRQEITGRDGEAIRYEEVKNEAADFTRAISGLADRARKGEDPLRIVGGSKSKP